MKKLSSKSHYYLPGALIGAIGGSQFKDVDPSTGESTSNPINVGLGAALGLAGGHIAGTKLPKYLLRKELLNREGISKEKIYNLYKDTFDKVTANAPRNIDNYYQNNLVTAPPTPKEMHSAVSEVMSNVKKHVDIMGKPTDFMIPEDIASLVNNEFSHSRLAPIVEQAVNTEFQKLRKGVISEYRSQMSDMSSTRPDRHFAKIRNFIERRRARKDLEGYMSQVAQDLPDATRKTFYTKQ